MPTLCSYCTRVADYVGYGSDGDFYCTTHLGRAYGGAVCVCLFIDDTTGRCLNCDRKAALV